MQQIRKGKAVRKMRPTEYEDWTREQDRERAHRARNRARAVTREAEDCLTRFTHHEGF